MSEIRLEQVGKVFDGGVRAVDDVSLTMESGEFMVSSARPAAASRRCCG